VAARQTHRFFQTVTGPSPFGGRRWCATPSPAELQFRPCVTTRFYANNPIGNPWPARRTGAPMRRTCAGAGLGTRPSLICWSKLGSLRRPARSDFGAGENPVVVVERKLQNCQAEVVDGPLPQAAMHRLQRRGRANLCVQDSSQALADCGGAPAPCGLASCTSQGPGSRPRRRSGSNPANASPAPSMACFTPFEQMRADWPRNGGLWWNSRPGRWTRVRLPPQHRSCGPRC